MRVEQAMGPDAPVTAHLAAVVGNPSDPGNVADALWNYVGLNERRAPPEEDEEEVEDYRIAEIEAVWPIERMVEESRDERLALAVVKSLKILSRARANRLALRDEHAAALVRLLVHPWRDTRILAECANVILNACYEKVNVAHMLAAGAVTPLLGLLEASEDMVRANASGALQSICYQSDGRVRVREDGGIPKLISLLGARDPDVRRRAVGCVHNISSDMGSIREMRRGGAILPLIGLLRHPDSAVCGSAAGALQNISRELASRNIIRDNEAALPLLDLLCSNDVQAQTCAAGALINILGPVYHSAEHASGGNKALNRVIGLALTLSSSYHALYNLAEEAQRDVLVGGGR